MSRRGTKGCSDNVGVAPRKEIAARTSGGDMGRSTLCLAAPWSFYIFRQSALVEDTLSTSRARSSAEIPTLRGVSKKTPLAMRCMPPSSA
jgi:hypothetical protein